MRVWIHPSRDQLDKGYRVNTYMNAMIGKVRRRMEVEPFAPVLTYHAVVVLAGVQDCAGAIRTATKLLLECPLGFRQAESWTWWCAEHPRPLIGLIAAERPLDRIEALGHFADCGVVPDASG